MDGSFKLPSVTLFTICLNNNHFRDSIYYVIYKFGGEEQMKSSTTFRSMLSKESMDVRENLAGEQPVEPDIISYNNEEDSAIAPNEYVRAQEEDDNKSQEIDLLWQTFKPAQFNSNSPATYIIGGILSGIIITTAIFFILGAMGLDRKGNMFGIFTPKKSSVESISDISSEETVSATVVSEDEKTPETDTMALNNEASNEITETKATIDLKNTKKYIVKDGDTVEAIIKHHYGAYTPERAENIMKANNLQNLDHISIGQVLLMPIEK